MAQSISAEYFEKPNSYFAGARKLFIDDLPISTYAKLLEIGCGNGDTSSYALNTGKCGWATGIEICPEPANEAKRKLNQVIVGDVEVMPLPFQPESFDVLIMSEVLEHLRDPRMVLKRLYSFLKPGSCVLAGSPNVAHHSVVTMLLRGRWDYSEAGLMDTTHLRWFTPTTFRQLFEDCGYVVDFVGPAESLRYKARWFNRLTLGRLEYLLHSQIYLKARRT